MFFSTRQRAENVSFKPPHTMQKSLPLIPTRSEKEAKGDAHYYCSHDGDIDDIGIWPAVHVSRLVSQYQHNCIKAATMKITLPSFGRESGCISGDHICSITP